MRYVVTALGMAGLVVAAAGCTQSTGTPRWGYEGPPLHHSPGGSVEYWLATGPRYIFFTRVSIKHRYSETDKLDAELTATAFEKVKDDKKKKAEAGKAAGKKE